MSTMMSVPAGKGFSAGIVVLAVGLGGLAVQQIERYLDVICLVRGECYGRFDWAYWLTLIPPLTLTGVVSSLLVIMLASIAASRFSLRLVGQGMMPDSTVVRSVRRTRRHLVGLGTLALIGFSAVAFWFTRM
ncbi:MAG: hypothetical protein ACOY5H_00245 [Pseudomonadota bacterium]